jgi:hypothetical protein
MDLDRLSPEQRVVRLELGLELLRRAVERNQHGLAFTEPWAKKMGRLEDRFEAKNTPVVPGEGNLEREEITHE